MLQYITFRVNLKVHLSNEAGAEIILLPNTFFGLCPDLRDLLKYRCQ